jgi:riboflavin synthase
MFTGIIEELGRVAALERRGDGAYLKIAAETVTGDAKSGDSIAVNGVCLTAIDITADSFAADVSGETLRRSTLGDLRAGAGVNLERAATVSTRLGGHIVQGHVDATGEFAGASQSGDFWTVRVRFPSEIAPYLIYKGSIAVEGISLTVANLYENSFDVAVIPKTWEKTNLHALRAGDAVNLEADVIAKYVERILLARQNKAEGVTVEKLQKLGFV